MGKIIRYRHFDRGDQQIAVYAQDFRDVWEFNERQRLDSADNWQKADPDIKPVARVPRVVWLLWQQQGICDDENELMRALERHPEWKRTEKRLI